MFKQSEEERTSLDSKWQTINTKLNDQFTTYKAPKQPFVKENLICDFNQLYHKIYDKVKAVEL